MGFATFPKSDAVEILGKFLTLVPVVEIIPFFSSGKHAKTADSCDSALDQVEVSRGAPNFA